MKIENLKFKISLLFALCSLLFAAPATHAQEFSVGVNPTIFEIRGTPPAGIVAPFTLENSSSAPVTFGIYLRPFKADSSLSGEPNYDQELSEEYNDLFERVQVYDAEVPVTELSLNPKEKKELNLRLNLDGAVSERDYYFTLVFLTKQDGKIPESNIAFIRGGAGINVLLSVAPEEKPQGRIANFTSPLFLSSGPVDFELELANHSDQFVTYRGNLIIKNMFGQAVGNIEFGPSNILSNSNRAIKLTWNEGFLLGVYKADLSVALSEKGPLLTQSKYFIALPVKGLAVLIGLILFLVWLLKAAKRKSNEN